jgi:hypothetical protein
MLFCHRELYLIKQLQGKTLFVDWKGGKCYNTLCAFLPRMNEPKIERPTLYGGGHIVNEVSVNVTCLCVLQL